MEDRLKESIGALLEAIDYLDYKPGSQLLPFEEARRIVRRIGLRSWREWSKSGKRPSNIPAAPHQVFRNAGWTSWPDWMGYGEGRVFKEEMLPFKAARRIVRGIGLRRVEGVE